MAAYQPKGLPLTQVVRWVIQTLVKMAQNRDWGEIRIVVQDGQIEFAHEQRSFRTSLPTDAKTSPAVTEVGRQLAGATG